MPRRHIDGGSVFEAKWGYARTVVDGRWVFVSGTTGFDYHAGTIVDDAREQTRQCFRNIAAALAEAGAGLPDVVRARYMIVDPGDVEVVLGVVGEVFRDVRPAVTAIICGLVDPRMKVEIEVTALLPEPQ
jgi:enamine deaminase RidA (YjgF/YER057c/UK114 family)